MVDPITVMLAGAAIKYTRDYMNQRAARRQRVQHTYFPPSPPSPPLLASNVNSSSEDIPKELSEDDASLDDRTISDDENVSFWCSSCRESGYSIFEQEWLRDPAVNFRIIELQPGEDNEPVVAKLVEGSIHTNEDYDTLSYRWKDNEKDGNPRSISHVHIGEGIFTVSDSVEFALLRLRHANRTRRLWIDQLCIVQKDDVTKATSEADKAKRQIAAAEKTEQLKIMGKIYKNAAQTIIWLGPYSSEPEVAACGVIMSFEPLRSQMGKLLEQHERSARRNGELNGKSASDIAVWKFKLLCGLMFCTEEELLKKGITKASQMPTLDTDAIGSIVKFYEREWFTRTWPVQEVVLSKDKFVMCGDEISLSWEQVGWFAAFFSQKYKHLDLSSSEMEGIDGAKYMYYYSSTYSTGFSFAEMLRATRRYEAGKPKDKVYALLGMVDFNLKSNGERYNQRKGVLELVPHSITVDSSDAFASTDLFYQVAHYFLQKDKGLEILSARQHVKWGDPLPRSSWVPQWDKREQSQHVWIPGTADVDNFAANIDLNPYISCATINFSGKTFQTCTIRGVEVDYIDVKLSYPLEDSDWHDFVHTIDILVIHDLIDRNEIWDHKIVEGLAMTLTAGRRQLGSVIPTSGPGCVTKQQQEHVEDFVGFILDLANHEACEKSGCYRPSENGFAPLLRHVKAISTKPRDKNGLKSSYATRCQEALRNRAICRTRSGRFAVVPVCANQDDPIVVLSGGRVPFVLREPAADSDEAMAGSHQLVGECYCYGLMNGESDSAMRSQSKFITLV